MHALVLEKNASLTQFFADAFRSESITCRMFENIADYFEEKHLDTVPPEVVVFDSDGFNNDDWSALIKSLDPITPIIVLTSKPGAKGRLEFLEQGAVDCLTKPIDGQELILRMQIACGRGRTSRFQLLSAEVQVDENKKDLVAGGAPVGLNHHEYLLAENFFYHPGRVFGRMALLELVWNRHSDLESNVVEATISGLRKKMKNHGITAQIKSKRNLGYWLEP